MLYAGADLAINGELQHYPAAAGSTLRRLANERNLSAATLRATGAKHAPALLSLLHDWYRFGWIQLGV
ncbi:hypothetical protein SBBP1_90020 [Burkholderiales bacterium]|nr:hypothetical protein SBBP1_90020 [Burkholderiales bacterium]